MLLHSSFSPLLLWARDGSWWCSSSCCHSVIHSWSLGVVHISLTHTQLQLVISISKGHSSYPSSFFDGATDNSISVANFNKAKQPCIKAGGMLVGGEELCWSGDWWDLEGGGRLAATSLSPWRSRWGNNTFIVDQWMIGGGQILSPFIALVEYMIEEMMWVE